MTFAARLIVYEPGGARLTAAMLDSVSWDATLPWNDVAALSLTYPSVFDEAGLADNPVELAVEVAGDDGWVEPPNARFLTSELQSDLTQPLDVPSFTFRGLAAVLERPFVLRESHNKDKPYTTDENDPKRNFLSATPGQIVLSVVNEARAKYPEMLDGITLNFTATKDSNGETWNQLISNAYSAGTDLLRILEDMVGQGNIDWWMQGRSLHVVNADSTTVKHAHNLFLENASESPVRVTWEGMATHIQLDGGQGFYRERTVKGVKVPYGSKVVRVANDSVTTAGTANAMLNEQARLAGAPRREYTRQIADLTNLPYPLVGWQVGDWLQAENHKRVYEEMRVHAVGIGWDAKQPMPDVRVTLNDRFVDAGVREAKRLDGITHGATQILGDGGLPSRVDKAVPAAPKGVTANSLGYWVGAIPWSSMDVSWQAVNSSVDGLAIETVDYYEVSVGIFTKQAKDGLSAGFDGLQPSRIYEVKVRAVSRTGVRGRWSAPVEVLTDYPQPDLDPPTTPTVTTGLSSIQIEWDGMLQGGNAPYKPPKHFSHIRVETRLAGGAWVSWPRDHGFVHTGLTVGDKYDVRLFAVDTLGRESQPSEIVRITVESSVQTALEAANTAASEAENARNQALEAWEAASGDIAMDRIRYTEDGFTVGVIDKLVGQEAFINAILTERLIVSSGNLIIDPNGNRIGETWKESTEGVWRQATTMQGWVGIRGYGNVAPGSWQSLDAQPNPTPLTEGETLSVKVRAYSTLTPDAANSAYLAVRWIGKDGANLGNAAVVNVGASGVADYSAMTPPAPRGTEGVRIWLQIRNTVTDGQVLFMGMEVRRGVGAVLIENGAVTTPKLVAGAITAEKIKAGALDAFQITAPLIQSVKTAKRGIKWNGNSFVAYNNSGKEMIRLEGDTGEISGVTITGGLIRTAASGPRVEISPEININQPGIRLYSGSSGGRFSTLFITKYQNDSGWPDFAVVLTGSETTTNETGRAQLVLEHGGDFRLIQSRGTHDGVGINKVGWVLALRGRLEEGSIMGQFRGGRMVFDVFKAGASKYATVSITPPPVGTRRYQVTPRVSSTAIENYAQFLAVVGDADASGFRMNLSRIDSKSGEFWAIVDWLGVWV